jgi:hypothetical protein
MAIGRISIVDQGHQSSILTWRVLSYSSDRAEKQQTAASSTAVLAMHMFVFSGAVSDAADMCFYGLTSAKIG